MNDNELLQYVSNMLTIDIPPAELLRDVATLLAGCRFFPQKGSFGNQTLRNFPEFVTWEGTQEAKQVQP